MCFYRLWLGVTSIFSPLFQNQVEWISLLSNIWNPAVGFHSTCSRCWKAYQKIVIERAPKIFAWELLSLFGLSVLIFFSLNFAITLSLFFSQWHLCKSSKITSVLVMEIDLHTAFSELLSPMSRDSRLNSRDSLWWFWALLTAFWSIFMIRWCRRVLQFVVINSSDLNSSYFFKQKYKSISIAVDWNQSRSIFFWSIQLISLKICTVAIRHISN